MERRLRIPGDKRLGFVLDVDGVIHRHGVPIPGVAEALARLRQNRIPYVFMTNSGCRSEAAKAEQISALVGHPILPDQVVLAHTPYRHFAKKYDGQRVLLLGAPACAEAAANYGFTNVVTSEELCQQWPELVPFKRFDANSKSIADANLAAHRALESTGEAGRAQVKKQLREAVTFAAVFAFDLFSADMLNDVQVALDALLDMDLPPQERVQRADIYFQCDDTFWAAADVAPPRLGESIFKHSVASMFRLATNGAHKLRFVQCGKPRRIQFAEARECLAKEAIRIDCPPLDEFVMVGDNPLVDIAGANHASGDWLSILVRTGVSSLPECTDSYFLQEHDEEGAELAENMARHKIPSHTSDSLGTFVDDLFLGGAPLFVE